MAQRTNPFHDLYLTEAIGPDRFVQLFSPKFVKHAFGLFQPGNVVLRGLQGSGKTMLLNLLKPEVRIAYANAGEAFPVPPEVGRFIGAGINLRKSGVMDFGHLVLKESDDKFVFELALQYGDFVNYWIVADLLQTIALFRAQGQGPLLESVGIHAGTTKLDEFAAAVARDDCWFGYLAGAATFVGLQERIRERIITYRKYVNLNLENDCLPAQMRESKTVVGDPILRVADALRNFGVLDADVEVFVRIDQYEQLPTLNMASHRFGSYCQDITHKALSARDARVSYRIGTRQYAWPDTPQIFGTQDALEHKRDYSIVDIDDKLRRKENSRTWIFPEFALDIFSRRLGQTTYAKHSSSKRLLEEVFGNSLGPADRAKIYLPTERARGSFLKLEPNLPRAWKTFLEALSLEDPLTAKFADAWVHQKGSAKKDVIDHPPLPGEYPWDAKPYWKKERTEQALLQIASANRQQLVWCGKDDVLGLSGGNILVFLFVCQHIWDAWLRDTRGNEEISASLLPRIDDEVQSQGIREASEEWINKLREGDDAHRRGRFLRNIGKHFYRKLTDDRAMSYPGLNGFSLSDEELAQAIDVRSFLNTCVEYGDLYDAPHTSKHKGEKRVKYYLAPILCPYFKVPYRHTKEPEYVRPERVIEWLSESVISKEAQGGGVAQIEMFARDESE